MWNQFSKEPAWYAKWQLIQWDLYNVMTKSIQLLNNDNIFLTNSIKGNTQRVSSFLLMIHSLIIEQVVYKNYSTVIIWSLQAEVLLHPFPANALVWCQGKVGTICSFPFPWCSIWQNYKWRLHGKTIIKDHMLYVNSFSQHDLGALMPKACQREKMTGLSSGRIDC